MILTSVRAFARFPGRSKLCLLAGLMLSVLAQADVPKETADKILSSLKSGRPDLNFLGVSASPIPGMYQVQLENGPMFFVSEDGQYFLTGDMYQVSGGEYVNLQEVERSKRRKGMMAAVSLDDQIIFKPKGKTKAVIQVFTDVDCGYCQKLHREIGDLNDYGIEVRYLAYPRAGVESATYDKLATAWCAAKPQDVLTKLKNRQKVEINVCENNPVAMEYQLGNMVGVRGTPALVLEDGSMIPGYVPAEELARRLGVL